MQYLQYLTTITGKQKNLLDPPVETTKYMYVEAEGCWASLAGKDGLGGP